MLTSKNKLYLGVMLLIMLSIIPINEASAAAFGSLTSAGTEIFEGLRDIIYPASAVGIIAICICGAFGTINWKWLTAIIIGLVVISLCAGFVALFVGDDAAKNIPANVMNGK